VLDHINHSLGEAWIVHLLARYQKLSGEVAIVYFVARFAQARNETREECAQARPSQSVARGVKIKNTRAHQS
jgi:predicted alpha/beta hydrolase family esterase